ncbi:MAG: ribosome small subunit-dependent GTPase A [Planctomycetes bacterium]|nr:ribosome small subunit-dependent GTPase A [Planctomycetota bacterium]
MTKKKKIRVPLRKNRQTTPRQRGKFSQQVDVHEHSDDHQSRERISRKGSITRYRTIVSSAETAPGQQPVRDVDTTGCLIGRVLSPHGGTCVVEAEDGTIYQCAVRRLLKSLATSERGSIAAGDRVLFRPDGIGQGLVERVEPRHGVLTRMIRRQKHVLAANVDQVLIVASAAEPNLKPSLIDRYLISANVGDIKPIICINKADLVDLVELQPLIGTYAQLGYEIVATSTRTGLGISRLKHLLQGRETALAGQSGVGKTSLINSFEPSLNLKTLAVTVETGKGKHTTTAARLLKLSFGGWVVDTPGIRQMELWDVNPVEVERFFLEFQPYLKDCRFPNCSHIHESRCGVKRAVVRGLISILRYDSYCRIRTGDADE